MYNLDENIITGAIDGYTNERNPITVEGFVVDSTDWIIDTNGYVTKTIESNDGVTLGFPIVEQLAYKTPTGLSISFTTNGNVQAVGIGDEFLFKYANKDTTDERTLKEDVDSYSTEEIERGTYFESMWSASTGYLDSKINEMVKDYTVGDDLYLFNWSDNELKDIIFNKGLKLRLTYTPTAEDTEDYENIKINKIKLNIYFNNELQDEIDIIQNRMECINIQDVIEEQANRGYKYIYSDTMPSLNDGEWYDEPQTPKDEDGKRTVYYTVYTLDDNYNSNEDYTQPEVYATYDTTNNKVIYYEYIYKVNNDPNPPKCPSETPSTGIAPTGWSMIRGTPSDRFRYGWKCIRSRQSDGTWSDYYGTLLNGQCVALKYDTDLPKFDWDIVPSYQYCYILVAEGKAPPVIEYITLSAPSENNSTPTPNEAIWTRTCFMGDKDLPTEEFSFERPTVSPTYPYLYMFRRERVQDDWSIWKGEGGIYKLYEYTGLQPQYVHYLRYTGILVDNYHWINEEDEVQYCYKIGNNTPHSDGDTNFDGAVIWSDDYYDEVIDGTTHITDVLPNQSDSFVPTGWSNSIPTLTKTNQYLYRLKRVKHLGRWGLWYGKEGGINYG